MMMNPANVRLKFVATSRPMTSIKIEPAGPRDFAMHREQFERLASTLREHGYDAEIETLEQRAVLPFSPDILIHIGEAGATAKGIIDLVGIVRRVLRRLRRPPSGEPRRVVIYGPNGEVLRTVELLDNEDDT
jgi:hypothetical protein